MNCGDARWRRQHVRRIASDDAGGVAGGVVLGRMAGVCRRLQRVALYDVGKTAFAWVSWRLSAGFLPLLSRCIGDGIRACNNAD